MLISTELVDELRAFARPRVSGKLFADLAGTRTIYNWIKEYARTARIEDWNYVTSNTLQNFFARSSSEFRAEVDKLPEAGLARRMSEYYIANYCLERDIRRLISETLGKNDEDWWKHKVPLDIQAHVRDLREMERNTAMSVGQANWITQHLAN